MAELESIQLDHESSTPIYRQLADSIASAISHGSLVSGSKLPPTRELAGQLGLNRTTISAAYGLLEEWKLIDAQVGRGSFVLAARRAASVNFASSHPATQDFPVDVFRQIVRKVTDSERAGDILQLGSSHGYGPLRKYLLGQAQAEGLAGPQDDLLITNGCQQALDLLARVFVGKGTAVAVEDPVYHGLIRVLGRAGAELLPVPIDEHGLVPEALEQTLLRHKPKLLVVTPTFQNPTGATVPLRRRQQIVALAQEHGCVLVENDIYSELRYAGEALPRLKELASSTVLLRSYSKVSFPGLRVGWVIAPRAIIARMAEAKEISDLHSDHLSQAVLLEFAQSGELAKHVRNARVLGAARLQATLDACERYLPKGCSFTTPEGGMSLWVELPEPFTAEALLSKVQPLGINFLPGPHFSASGKHSRGLRLCFGGLREHEIEQGIEIIGNALAGFSQPQTFEPAVALV